MNEINYIPIPHPEVTAFYNKMVDDMINEYMEPFTVVVADDQYSMRPTPSCELPL